MASAQEGAPPPPRRGAGKIPFPATRLSVIEAPILPAQCCVLRWGPARDAAPTSIFVPLSFFNQLPPGSQCAASRGRSGCARPARGAGLLPPGAGPSARAVAAEPRGGRAHARPRPVCLQCDHSGRWRAGDAAAAVDAAVHGDGHELQRGPGGSRGLRGLARARVAGEPRGAAQQPGAVLWLPARHCLGRGGQPRRPQPPDGPVRGRGARRALCLPGLQRAGSGADAEADLLHDQHPGEHARVRHLPLRRHWGHDDAAAGRGAQRALCQRRLRHLSGQPPRAPAHGALREWPAQPLHTRGAARSRCGCAGQPGAHAHQRHQRHDHARHVH